MATIRLFVPAAFLGLLAAALTLSPGRALAHCDTMDGPVVKAAQASLEKGSPDRALVWVQKKDEAEIRGAFELARTVRKLGPEARRLADQYFLETLVRAHRAGEGEPYTGIKPAGLDQGPVIPAVDRALATGNPDALARLITTQVQTKLRERFASTLAARRYATADVAAGREYVECYVEFMHYAERLYDAATLPSHGHIVEPTLGAGQGAGEEEANP